MIFLFLNLWIIINNSFKILCLRQEFITAQFVCNVTWSKRCATNRDMHGLEDNIEHQMWTWETTVTVWVILLPDFKIPEPEEEPTMSASTCLKAEKTSMIFLFIWLIFPDVPVWIVYFLNILFILAYWKYMGSILFCSACCIFHIAMSFCTPSGNAMTLVSLWHRCQDVQKRMDPLNNND